MLNTPRYFEKLSTKMNNINKLNILLLQNKKFLERFKLIIDTESVDYTIEDSLTGKIYQYESYEKLFSEINADLRKEKIEKLLTHNDMSNKKISD